MCPLLRESGGCVPKNLYLAIHLHKDLRLTVVPTSPHYDPTASPSRLQRVEASTAGRSRNARSSNPTRRWWISPMPSFFSFFFSSPLFPFSALVDLPYVRPWEHRRRPARPPTARALGRGTSTVCLASRRDPPLRLPPSSLPPNPPCAGGRSAALPSSGLRARSRRPGCSRAFPPAACRLGHRRREERRLRARLQPPARAQAQVWGAAAGRAETTSGLGSATQSPANLAATPPPTAPAVCLD